MEETESELATRDRSMRWAITASYLVAIGLNLYFFYEMVKDKPEFEILAAKVRRERDRLTAPFTEPGRFRRAKNRMLFEAMTIVEEEADA